MENYSAFNELILKRNVYVLWAMIDHIPPQELRNLARVNRAAHRILGLNVKFIGKAYISALRDYTVTNWNTLPPINGSLSMDQNIGRLAEFLVIVKYEDPQARWVMTRLMMERIGDTHKARAEYNCVKIKRKSEIAQDTYDETALEFEDVMEEMKAIELKLELLEKDDSPDMEIAGFLQEMRRQLRYTRHDVKQDKREYGDSLQNINMLARFPNRKGDVRYEKSIIRSRTKIHIPIIRHFWPTFREETEKMIKDLRYKMAEAYDKLKRYDIHTIASLFSNTKTASMLTRVLTAADIRTLRSTSKQMELAIATSPAARTKALYQPLKRSLKESLIGKTETNLLAWLYKNNSIEWDKYTLLRRLINKRIAENISSSSMMEGGRHPVTFLTIEKNSNSIRLMHHMLRTGELQRKPSWTKEHDWKARIEQFIGLHNHMHKIFQDRYYWTPNHARMSSVERWEKSLKYLAHVDYFIPQLTAEAKYIACNPPKIY